jgi:hypothetical protein
MPAHKSFHHKVERFLAQSIVRVHITTESVPSSELGPRTLSPPNESVPPPEPRGGAGEVVGGGPNSDDWRKSLALCQLCGAGLQQDV